MASPPFPPLDFSLFGLSGWYSARWVEFVEGELGKPVWSVTLAHHDDSALVLVKTSPRERWDRLMAGGEQSGATEFASDLVRVVIDMARADFEAAERSQYNRAVPTFAQKEGAQWETWQPVQWSLDAQPIQARIWRFAHAWTGLTLAVPGHYVGVTSFRIEDTGVNLVEVLDTEYNFDFTVPFHMHGLEVQIPDRPSTHELSRPQSRHHDHGRVLDS